MKRLQMQAIYDQEKVKLLQQSSTAMASPGETASALPQYQRVKSSLYHERRKRFPLMPSTRGDINLDGQWTTTVHGDSCLARMAIRAGSNYTKLYQLQLHYFFISITITVIIT